MNIIFFHPPSFFGKKTVYDWHSSSITGSGKFDIFPEGLSSLVHYLTEHGFESKIVNLAKEVSTEEELNGFLKKLSPLPSFFGISFHWLAHAGGVAFLMKKLKSFFPDIPIIVGGLSAGYFFKELILKPECNYIIRGICAEKSLLKLLKSQNQARRLARIANLVWKNDDDVVVNAKEQNEIPSVKCMGALLENDPVKWSILCYKGCTEKCIYCGGNNDALKLKKIVKNSEDNIIWHIRSIAAISRKPIKFYGDFRKVDTDKVLRTISNEEFQNKFVFEVFYPAEKQLIQKIARSCKEGFEIAISPDSSFADIRAAAGKHRYSNNKLEEMISQVLDTGGSIPIFFLLGLPKQDYTVVQRDLHYIDYLHDKYSQYGDSLVTVFTTMAPYVDPGSAIYETPEKYGYKIFSKKLSYYETLLLQKEDESINYESKWTSRRQIVQLTKYVHRAMSKYRS